MRSHEIEEPFYNLKYLLVLQRTFSAMERFLGC